MKRHLSTLAIALVAGALAAGATQTLFSAMADQSERVPPTSGIFTGVQFSQLIGNAVRSISSANKGSAAPANVGGDVVDGLEWIDDSTTPWVKKRYVNGGWAVEGALDPTDSSYVGVIGGGLATISAAATVDLGSVPQAAVTISGAATITSFGGSALAGIVKIIRFDDAATISPSSALTVPGGYPLTTSAGDRGIAIALGSGNWEITNYTRANGIPIDVSRVGKQSFDFSVSVSSVEVVGGGQALPRASYPAYFAKTTRPQNGTRTSGNATITGVANTSGFGVGMPVEATGVSAGCTIASMVANTSITLNSSACVTASGTSTVTVFPYGYGAGGDATTVGVPDCRAVSIAGRDPTLGSGRLTSTYFGANPSVYGVTGGSESTPMAIGNLIQHTHGNTLSQTDHHHSTIVATSRTTSAQIVGGASAAFWTGETPVFTGDSSANISINNAAAGSSSPTPMRTIGPTLIAECTVRVIP